MAQQVEVPGVGMLEFPDGMSQPDMAAAIQKNFPKAANVAQTPTQQPFVAQKQQPAEELNWFEKKLAGVKIPTDVNQRLDKVRGLVMGAADPTVGAVQLAANAVGLGDKVNPVIQKKEAEYEKTRALRGSEGFDAYRTVGNVLSPVNAVPAGYLSRAAGVGQMARRGAVVGAATGAAMPTTGSDFWTEKATQTGAGAVGGAILTPAISKAASVLANTINRGARAARPVPPQVAAQQADTLVNEWVTSAGTQGGIDLSQIPQPILASVRTRVAEALATGRRIDPAEIVRRADFEAVGVNPTAAQLSRDPTQFANERNLRGINTGSGNALADRYAQQGTRLRDIFRDANGADEPQVAGGRLSEMLRRRDAPRQEAIGDAYRSARDSSGRAANVDVPAFSEAANRALDEGMLGSYLPAEARTLLNDVSAGRIPLNVNNLVQIDRVLSGAQRAAGQRTPQGAAIGVVRDALNAAPIEGGAGQETKAAFDAARGMARDRFQTIERVPALRAALDNEDPDRFVSRYLIGAPTRDVRSLSALTRRDPEARTAMRSQVSEFLRSKAFGVDATGDAPFSPERYNKALQSMGREKLRALFSPQEVDRLYTAGRVMAYIKTQPEGSAVNNSNTGAAVMNLLGEMTGKIGQLPGANMIRDSVRNFQNERGISAALRPAPAPIQQAPLPPQAQNLMNLLRIGTATGAGSASGRAVRE